MWVLLGLVLGGRGAAAFVVHVASSCPLAPNGSVRGFELALLFNKNPLVCYDPRAHLFVPCDGGLLQPVATALAADINNGSAWKRRAQERHRACRDMGGLFWASAELRRTPPQIRIVPSKTSDTGTPLLLTCHLWGFYPPEVTVVWLHNGVMVGPRDPPPTPTSSNGDWTYQTQVTLAVAPAPGDTFTCLVQHSSLKEPLQEEWSPGLSPGLTLQVAVAAVVVALGLGGFTFGLCRYWARPAAAGYTPLPGDTYPAGNI